MDRFELPTGGGALLLAWQLKDKRVLMVGGGEVASGRIKSLLIADAYITLIAPRDGLHPLTKFYIDNSDRITHHDRTFEGPTDLASVDMVLTAIDDVEWGRRICAMCREQRIPVNVADIPPSCDFYFGSQIRKGPLQIMISTNGNGPKLASIVKSRIEDYLPQNVDKAIENVGSLRAKLRQRASGVGGEISKKRMRWISSVCTTWDLDELAGLDEAAMDTLLVEGWERDVVPRPNRTKAVRSKPPSSPNIALATFVGFFCGIAFCVAILGEQSIFGNFFTNIMLISRDMFSPFITKWKQLMPVI
ncbi:MET8 [Sanghuangporus vaninii]